MLDADREQVVGLHFEGLAVQTQRAHPDVAGAGDRIVDARHREATFLTFAFAGFFQQLGVDQGQQLRLAFGNVDHDQTHVPVDL